MILKQKTEDFSGSTVAQHIIGLRERLNNVMSISHGYPRSAQNVSDGADIDLASRLVHDAGFVSGILGFANDDTMGDVLISDETRADIAINAIRSIKRALMERVDEPQSEGMEVSAILADAKSLAITLAQQTASFLNEDNDGLDINVDTLMVFERQEPLVLKSQFDADCELDYGHRLAFLDGALSSGMFEAVCLPSNATSVKLENSFKLASTLLDHSLDLHMGLANDIIPPALRAKTCLEVVRSVNQALSSGGDAYKNGEIGDYEFLDEAFSVAIGLSEEVVDMLNRDNTHHPAHQRDADLKSGKALIDAIHRTGQNLG